MADHSAEIRELEALLNSATRGVSVDGTTANFDLEAARKRLNYLKSLDSETVAAGGVRPRIQKLNLSTAW